LGYAGYRHYDRTRLSSGLRQTLIAAVDPSSTDSDVLIDLGNARSQIYTTRDAEVEARFERVLQLAQIASDANQRIRARSKAASAASANLDKYLAMQKQYQLRNMEVPQNLKDYIQRAAQKQKEAQQKLDPTLELDRKLAEDDSAEARNLLQQLRGDLGLPPLPPTPNPSRLNSCQLPLPCKFACRLTQRAVATDLVEVAG
jgi:hypothetical protein